MSTHIDEMDPVNSHFRIYNALKIKGTIEPTKMTKMPCNIDTSFATIEVVSTKHSCKNKAIQSTSVCTIITAQIFQQRI